MKIQKVSARRTGAGMVAGLMAMAIVLTGTFAWNWYLDHKTNEGWGRGGEYYKARLIENFDPTQTQDWKVGQGPVTKQLAVFNPGKETSNDTLDYGYVFVRIQLKEFLEYFEQGELEYTPDPYMIDTNGKFLAFDSREAAKAYLDGTASLSDGTFVKYGKDGGANYTGDTTSNPADRIQAFQIYGDTITRYYIQTRQGDANGVYGARLPLNFNAPTDATNVMASTGNVPSKAYDDEANSHSAHTNGECYYTPHLWTTTTIVEAVQSTGNNPPVTGFYPNGSTGDSFEQYIKWYLGTNVVLFSKWDKNPVAKWILDDTDGSDGWAYWGMPLAPGDTTSNLLESIELIKSPGSNFNYYLHADMQAVDYSELGEWDSVNSTWSTSALGWGDDVPSGTQAWNHKNLDIITALKTKYKELVPDPLPPSSSSVAP